MAYITAKFAKMRISELMRSTTRIVCDDSGVGDDTFGFGKLHTGIKQRRHDGDARNVPDRDAA